ncbi:MAG TPA: ATP-binding protein, partial [Usitatibacter sp.]|nr:ATP-binding protein [Usitatibacter sp.]
IGLHRISQDPGADHSGLVAECLEIAESTLESLRRVALELRPPQLDQLGLAAALAWLAARQAAATGLAIECSCSAAEGWRAPHALESACYRIAQEALNNATKHANASAIRIALDPNGELLKLSIHDDGTGFDPEAARHKALRSGSLGLISMEERAELSGGRLRVRSVAGGGTTVTAIFPLGVDARVEAASDALPAA